jgi:hypothetical protein
MVISHSHRFIFIHIYKVAGTSIANALYPYAWKPNPMVRLIESLGIKLPHSLVRDPFSRHISALQLRNGLPSVTFDDFFKFAFVRNPWDWQVSLFHYARSKKSHHQHRKINALRDFEDYIQWRVTEDRKLQKDFVCDESGELLVDFVGKYENLESDFQKICNTLEIDGTLPHLNRSIHRDYKSYYTEKSVRLIEEHFEEDIDFFQYRFE